MIDVRFKTKTNQNSNNCDRENTVHVALIEVVPPCATKYYAVMYWQHSQGSCTQRSATLSCTGNTLRAAARNEVLRCHVPETLSGKLHATKCYPVMYWQHSQGSCTQRSATLSCTGNTLRAAARNEVLHCHLLATLSGQLQQKHVWRDVKFPRYSSREFIDLYLFI